MSKLLTDIAAVLAATFVQMADRQSASWTFTYDENVKVTVERISPVTYTEALAYDENMLGVPV
jgi:hypothetical protein